MDTLTIIAGVGGFIIILEEIVKIIKWIRIGIDNVTCAIEMDKRHKQYDAWKKAHKEEA